MAKHSSSFVVRTTVDIHTRLKAAAQRLDQSLNDLCVRRLMVPATLDGLCTPPLGEALAIAEAVFGADLAAVVVYGSWARGQATNGSDVDLLVVLSPRVDLDRALYARWDQAIRGKLDAWIEVHFVHLPDAGGRATAFWAEIAMDGIVLFDRSLDLSRHLCRVRHAIGDGRLVRKTSHGQAYWIDSGGAA